MNEITVSGGDDVRVTINRLMMAKKPVFAIHSGVRLQANEQTVAEDLWIDWEEGRSKRDENEAKAQALETDAARLTFLRESVIKSFQRERVLLELLREVAKDHGRTDIEARTADMLLGLVKRHEFIRAFLVSSEGSLGTSAKPAQDAREEQTPRTVRLHECVHCRCIVVNTSSDRCSCGGELADIAKSAAPGVRIRGVQLSDVEAM